MENSKSEGSLLEEIKFLTNLIESHHMVGSPSHPSAAAKLGKRTRTSINKWSPAGSSNTSKRPKLQPAGRRHLSAQPPKQQWRSQNKVYRPLQTSSAGVGGSAGGGVKQSSSLITLREFPPPLTHSTPQKALPQQHHHLQKADSGSKLFLPPKRTATQKPSSNPKPLSTAGVVKIEPLSPSSVRNSSKRGVESNATIFPHSAPSFNVNTTSVSMLPGSMIETEPPNCGFSTATGTSCLPNSKPPVSSAPTVNTTINQPGSKPPGSGPLSLPSKKLPGSGPYTANTLCLMSKKPPNSGLSTANTLGLLSKNTPSSGPSTACTLSQPSDGIKKTNPPGSVQPQENVIHPTKKKRKRVRRRKRHKKAVQTTMKPQDGREGMGVSGLAEMGVSNGPVNSKEVGVSSARGREFCKDVAGNVFARLGPHFGHGTTKEVGKSSNCGAQQKQQQRLVLNDARDRIVVTLPPPLPYPQPHPLITVPGAAPPMGHLPPAATKCYTGLPHHQLSALLPFSGHRTPPLGGHPIPSLNGCHAPPLSGHPAPSLNSHPAPHGPPFSHQPAPPHNPPPGHPQPTPPHAPPHITSLPPALSHPVPSQSKKKQRGKRTRKGKQVVRYLPRREQLKWQRPGTNHLSSIRAGSGSHATWKTKWKPNIGSSATASSPIKRSKNRVWAPTNEETEVVFITPKPPDQGAGQAGSVPDPDRDRLVPESNEQDDSVIILDVTNQSVSEQIPVIPVEPVQLLGHEKKTKRGNKQWVAGSATPSRKGVVKKRKTPRTKANSALVAFSGGRYAVDSSGRRLKRLSSSSKSTGGLLGGRYTMDASGKRLKRLSSSSYHSKHTGSLNGGRYAVSASGKKLKRVSTSGLKPRRKRSLVSFNGGQYSMDSSGKKLKRLSTPLKSRHVVSISGANYAMDSSRKRLKRLSTSSLSQPTSWSPAISSYIGGVANSSTFRKRMLASRVVKKSKAYVWHARRKKKLDRGQQFCLFFNRFGKCNKGKDCPYIHDPDKIAVCTRFLKGTCDKTDGSCPFSHKISREKMPVCSFFLRGVCGREECPYLHVSVGRDAEVCPDFIKGYCPRGEKCTMQHTLDCPKFSLTGSCPDGAKCQLRHSRKPREEPQAMPVPLVKEPHAFKRVRYNIAKVLASRSSGANAAPPGGEGGPEEGEGSGERSTSVSPITVRELDFLPLDVNAAPDFIPL